MFFFEASASLVLYDLQLRRFKLYVNYSFCQCWAQFCKEITGKEYLKYNLTCKGIKITPCRGRSGWE